MGVIRTVRGEDGRPYVSLEDLIKEVEDVKKSVSTIDGSASFVDIVLKTLHGMEEEYYSKYLFGKKDQ